MINRLLLLLLLLFSLISFADAQDQNEEKGYFVQPSATRGGILFTDNYASSIYLFADGNVKKIISSPNCGRYYSIDKSNNLLGFKRIDETGRQIPAVYNLSENKIVALSEAESLAGQPSFADDGSIAFTVGSKLFVKNKSSSKQYYLGCYSNITPISPDAKYAVFNDDSDQLFLFDLQTNKKKKISNDKFGYFTPVWSPNSKYILYSTLGGQLFLYNLESDKSLSIGEGYSVSWAGNSASFIFYKKVVEDMKLINSDIYVYFVEGNKTAQLTNTKNIIEIDPSFSPGDKEVIYFTYNHKELMSITIDSKSGNVSAPKLLFSSDSIEPKFYQITNTQKAITELDMPYVHQVYDTPDWHNGHWSCAPTAASMVLAYYELLPKWEGWCSWPSPGHTNQYGRYVADRYKYKEYYYQSASGDPNGNDAWGGYGYMWSTGSPHTRMAGYYQKHGLSAVQTESPSYSEAKAEVEAGYPYTMCVLLTSAGHLIVANGLYTERTLIFNDPYGNKNTPNYPSYDGKSAKYDWPGYNNGYQNLNQVAWCIKHRYDNPSAPDSIVDDMEFADGFYLNTKAPASMSRWLDKNQGYNNHFWFAKTNASGIKDTCYAIWRPTLSQSGYYEVSAYISLSNSTDARYKILHNQGQDTVIINQKDFSNEWVSLGKYNFNAGGGMVRLGDASSVAGEEIVFDAVKWSYISPLVNVTEENFIPKKFELLQNYPNPFNPATKIKYSIPSLETHGGASVQNISLKVYDILGNEVATIENEEKAPGDYEITFDAKAMGVQLSSGVYFYSLQSGDFYSVKKMIFLQ